MEQRRTGISTELITLLVFCALLVVIGGAFAMMRDAFLTVSNFINLFKHMSPMALVGLGLTFVLVVGYADMSFHFVSCFAGMTMSYMITCGLSPAESILIGCAGGAIFGVVNGVMVGRFKLPDMVATLALDAIAFGMAYLYSGGTQLYDKFMSSGIELLYNAKIEVGLTFLTGLLGFGKTGGGVATDWRIPLPVILMLGAYVMGFVVLNRSTLGRRFYAIGSNATAARLSGVRVERYLMAAFVICAVVASFTNILHISSLGKGEIESGVRWLMPAYASVFVGVSVFKKPTVIGTLLGALLIGTVQNGFTLMGKETYVMELVTGLLLIVSIVTSKIDFKEIIRKRRLRAEIAAGGGAS